MNEKAITKKSQKTMVHFFNAETVLECLAEGVAAKELSTKRNSAILRDVADVHA